jgi:L-fucose mutarotase
MLKGIDNRLNADVLYALRAMGHGDVLIVCDTNFPADSIARDTALGELLHMDNLTAAQAAEAILSVLPLDTFVDDFAGRMEVVSSPPSFPPSRPRSRPPSTPPTAERRAWSASSASPSTDMARDAYAVIQTGERRFYGCFMFRKGVIPPDA